MHQQLNSIGRSLLPLYKHQVMLQGSCRWGMTVKWLNVVTLLHRSDDDDGQSPSSKLDVHQHRLWVEWGIPDSQTWLLLLTSVTSQQPGPAAGQLKSLLKCFQASMWHLRTSCAIVPNWFVKPGLSLSQSFCFFFSSGLLNATLH